MNPTNSFVEVARGAFDDNCIEELEEFLKIMDSHDVDEEEFYKYLDFDHEDAISSTPPRNHSTFDDDDDIIELANYLTEAEFSPTLLWQPECDFSLRSSATYHSKRS